MRILTSNEKTFFFSNEKPQSSDEKQCTLSNGQLSEKNCIYQIFVLNTTSEKTIKDQSFVESLREGATKTALLTLGLKWLVFFLCIVVSVSL